MAPPKPSPPVPARKPSDDNEPASGELRRRLWRIIFLSDTFAGKMFDIALLAFIACCVIVVMLESVESLNAQYASLFAIAEWVFTIAFTVEYFVRLWVVGNRKRYATSFFGVIDLISILPSYLELLLPGSHYLLTVRILRMLRMFRILKMADYVGESQVLLRALRASRSKITVFLASVVAIVCVEGTMMYVIENKWNEGFSSIPSAIYWAIVTITTVGFGDITPVTVPGKLMACVIMLTGFSIIAVPTGVVTSELNREIAMSGARRQPCHECGWDRHDKAASYCDHCGKMLTMDG
jgi:voltage-gated potassium channel